MTEVLAETAEETIVRLVHRVKELEDELRDELTMRRERESSPPRGTVFCAYCGFVSAGHEKVCAKNPLRLVGGEVDRLRKMGLALLEEWSKEAQDNSPGSVVYKVIEDYQRRKKEWES